ncbi:hypothetical protein FJQ54_11095 [Sandaracinobacter neustonicus]|uniref:5-bromo-4-chloroindolyl phosphate hydrolysis protein n=1 Tax=Sandaracinobacter neustonicus TaxID=1715348 RepID=A0A501XJ15_9SPHN|nr:hypothetical protein [Sandaracinobacter neustonicus]TPE60536.1 hypothetical protein FJQ54_11095 [Sandaracinobacter neustonicus]
MSMQPETRDALARYDAWLERTTRATDSVARQAKRVERGARNVGRRMRNMAFAVLAVLLGAFFYGNLVAPLGFLGVMVTVVAVLCAMLLFASWPRARAPKLEKLPAAPLGTLPAQVEGWLEAQRPALPAPAAREIDMVMAQLDRLAPELKQLDPATPQADDARKLLSDHLPRLVKSYAEVPASHRATPEAQAHFRDGLRVVGGEMDRLAKELATERLRALETEGRFLESRYGGKKD